MNITPEELAILIGSKEVEIFLLKKQLSAALKRIEELMPKPDAPV